MVQSDIAVQDEYFIGNNQLKLVVIEKLINSTLNWFHSKADHVHYSLQELLENIAKIFDSLPNKLLRTKKFESKKWQCDEMFASYYNDKNVLANKKTIEELVEYLIEGLDDSIMQSQARIVCFKSPVFKNYNRRSSSKLIAKFFGNPFRLPAEIEANFKFEILLEVNYYFHKKK